MSRMKVVMMLAAVAALATLGPRPGSAAREVDAVARERAPGAKNTLTVTIGGPTKVLINGECTWAVSVSGGTPPYTYDWLGFDYVYYDLTRQSAVGGWYGPLPGKASIWVDVTDSNNDYGFDGHGVQVSTVGQDCVF